MSVVPFYDSFVLVKGKVTLAKQPIPSNRDEILKIKIKEMYMVLEAIVFRGAGRAAAKAVSLLLPSVLSPAGATHASLYIPTSSTQGIILEYGAYDYKREGEFMGQVHYFQGDGGLRFAKVSSDELTARLNKSKFNTAIECSIRNEMTIGELLSHFAYENWSRETYQLAGQNCQRFVLRSIEILEAERKSRDPHIISKTEIPFAILKTLETNEKRRK